MLQEEKNRNEKLKLTIEELKLILKNLKNEMELNRQQKINMELDLKNKCNENQNLEDKLKRYKKIKCDLENNFKDDKNEKELIQKKCLEQEKEIQNLISELNLLSKSAVSMRKRYG